MLKDITEARPLGGHSLFLRYEAGGQGVVDIPKMFQFTGLFARIADTTFFAEVTAEPGPGTVTRPSDDPDPTPSMPPSSLQSKRS
jgi:hypothetical protein